jgi:hypothetical protein
VPTEPFATGDPFGCSGFSYCCGLGYDNATDLQKIQIGGKSYFVPKPTAIPHCTTFKN